MNDEELVEEKDMQNIEEDLDLTDLFDVELLQQVQNAFSSMTGMAVLTTDKNGIPVTKGANFTKFCSNTRSTPIGCFRCEQCDNDGAMQALERGHSFCYTCHAGMVEFAAPIMANGRMIGCFVGGQVRTSPPDIAQIFQVAREIGVDAIGYLQSSLDVPIMKQEDIDKAADFLYTIADIISSITYHKYVIHKANIEIEKAAHMKSDFLANMSHEIRTPMNAVIGMAEMALREEMSPAAKDYINQIKSSGKTLLTIINDILDFSKIESGKMPVIESEYEPLSIINDVNNIIMTRIGKKSVELILDISPDIPYKLMGDGVRIKQILTNISNNAVKFTEEGQVAVSIDFEKVNDESINLLFSVKDTGIGIKKEDLNKLFQSFQQLNSKRNRNIEGTGLGLAISKQLLSLMDGNIEVESEYGKGTTFRFYVPQKIVNDRPGIILKEDKKNITVAALVENTFIREQLEKDIIRLGADFVWIRSIEEFRKLSEKDVKFLFIDYPLFSKEVKEYVKTNPELNAVLMMPFDQMDKYEMNNLILVKKPLYSLNIAMLLNGEDLHTYFVSEENDDFDFVAPEANILIVDDNSINLTVAKGLLEPLKMQIDTALSGKEAIDKISEKRYDLIFMDHMMPEVDGVETTHIIRRFHEEYNDVPIIALTANAVEGTKEMFLREGMNDFIPKPIEMMELVSKLRKWLPQDKIKKGGVKINKPDDEPKKEEELIIDNLDTRYALAMIGSKKLYLDVLKDYYHAIDRKENLIRELLQNRDWHGYTIEVHALKSASKQIGAMELSSQAAEMEKAGNEENIASILLHTESMLELYHSYKEILKPFFEEEKKDDAPKQNIGPDILREIFKKLETALDNLDMDEMEAVIQELSQYEYPDWQQELFEQLKVAVDGLDVDSCTSIWREWESRL